MRHFLTVIACCFVVVQADDALFAGQPRDRSFDNDWRFLQGDIPGAEAPAFDDSSWRKLDLPHDWSIEDLPVLPTAAPELKTDKEGSPAAENQAARIGPLR